MNAPAEQTTAPAEPRPAEPSPADAPYRLLWSVGIAAVVLCVVAFALWGLNGAGTLIDMTAVLCT